MPSILARRAFLAASALGTASCAAGSLVTPPAPPPAPPPVPPPAPAAPPPAPPAAAAAHGITVATVAEAEKLALVHYTPAERELIAADGDKLLGFVRERRARVFPNAMPPATLFDPRPFGTLPEARRDALTLSATRAGPLPRDDRDIAFAPVTALGEWIRTKQLSSARLTAIYLDRLRRIGPQLSCVVTLTPELAERQARAADAEIAAGRYRGPLHGVPWGAKDLLDTAGIATTWGAALYKSRVPTADAAVVRRLAEAGAVLLGKLSLGELANGDVWFGGRTKNPWNLAEGSSGSSAGPGAATAAGLCAFAIGSETLGSIVAPSVRCGTVGLRPTFGRVPRTGAMSLCWSLDKLGPMTRSVEDAVVVLAAIHGGDAGDACARTMPLAFDAGASVRGKKVGYAKAWFDDKDTTDVERAALLAAKRAGLDLVEIEAPQLPFGALLPILFAEAAAAFEEITLTDQDDQLVEQHREAWPNTLREARFLSAVDLIQAERLRREAMEAMARTFDRVDALIGPGLLDSMLVITNMTGHPSLTLRAGFIQAGPRGFDSDLPLTAEALAAAQPKVSVPQAVTLWGRLYDEGGLCRIGAALEAELGVQAKRPPIG